MFSLNKLFKCTNKLHIASTLDQAFEMIRRASKIKCKDYSYATYLATKRNKRYRVNYMQSASNSYEEIECFVPLYDISSKQWRSDYPKWSYVFKVKTSGTGAYIDLNDVALFDSFRYFEHLTNFELNTFISIVKEQLYLE